MQGSLLSRKLIDLVKAEGERLSVRAFAIFIAAGETGCGSFHVWMGPKAIPMEFFLNDGCLVAIRVNQRRVPQRLMRPVATADFPALVRRLASHAVAFGQLEDTDVLRVMARYVFETLEAEA